MNLNWKKIEEMNANPLYRSMGIRIETAEPGKTTSRLDPTPEMCWPSPGQPHGGVLFTLMDTTMAWAVIAGSKNGNSCATIHMDIQYNRPARGTSFFCKAEVTSQTTRVSFITAVIEDTDGNVLAMGQGTYRVITV